MATSKTQVVFDSWDSYVRQADDYPFFISFDVEAAREDLIETLTVCARLAIPIHQPGPSGGPEQPEHERLWDMEDQLCSALSERGITCRLVGRLTHRGYRVLVFQLDDWESFRSAVEEWIQANGDYQIQVSDSDGWEFFNEVVRPMPEDWLFMADCKVVQNLLEHGSDPDKEHALEFVLLGEPAALDRMAELLQAEGYQRNDPFETPSGRMVMVKRMKLDLNEVTAASLALSRLAAEHNVQYDGWGAAIVP
jgi:regulator of RNase E activity RraB